MWIYSLSLSLSVSLSVGRDGCIASRLVLVRYAEFLTRRAQPTSALRCVKRERERKKQLPPVLIFLQPKHRCRCSERISTRSKWHEPCLSLWFVIRGEGGGGTLINMREQTFSDTEEWFAFAWMKTAATERPRGIKRWKWRQQETERAYRQGKY